MEEKNEQQIEEIAEVEETGQEAGKKEEGKAAKPKTATPRASRRKQPVAEAKVGNVPAPTPRMLERYKQEVAPAMIKDFSYGNVMQVPRVSKVVVNIGLAEGLLNPKAVEAAMGDLTAIVGQRPVTTKAKKSIAGFKLRKGMTVGMMVTLRGSRMWEFLDRLLNVALPRIRDFRGIPRHSFDGRGNFSLGLREQTMFPEIDYNAIDRLRGLQIAIVTTAKTDEESLRLLEHLGMPFSKN
ncbi:MAG: large subunit ribosomal protein L5 [Chloroflexi bacterium]|jgi:large subunit ribosomal protein L5|nr:MAG: large subunit ribosomal protein L5 [Chloroflexota bacterium]